jgi:hypothetical protein
VATDLTESYRAGLHPHLADVTVVADPFHVVRVANRCLDKVRRRVQTETEGHRGQKNDPLFKIRKLMLTGAERLDERGRQRILLGLRAGDPNDEVAGAWLAKESVRDVYLATNPADAALLLDKVIAGCLADEVEEIRSLGKTLARWRAPDPRLPPHRRIERPNRRTQPVREEGQPLRPRIPPLRPLPAPRTPPHRRHHLARQTPPTPNPLPHLSPLKRVEPPMIREQTAGTSSAITLQ